MGDTIYALATPQGRGAIALIRLSGPDCAEILARLSPAPPPRPRMAQLRVLTCPKSGARLDEALVIFFAAPHSYSGEDMLELHLHGGTAVVAGVLAALESLPRLRQAEAGEFSRRAVLNGRLDMTQAEAIADLIDAESAAQRAQALRQMRGELGQLYEGWRARISAALAHLEADIEFADEDLPGGLGQSALDALRGLPEAIAAHLADPRGEKLRDGFCVAIIGPPNAGKSSLLNHLVGRDAAITAPQAGTTRDIVEVALTLGGVPVTLADTAGLRDGAEAIEREGVARARARAASADMRIFLESVDARFADSDLPLLADKCDGDFHLINKCDLDASLRDEPRAISVQDGTGLAAFNEALAARIAARFSEQETPPFTRARHRAALSEALTALTRALAPPPAAALELTAEDLRLAARALGRITGAVEVEALLDIVFRDFCIGK